MEIMMIILKSFVQSLRNIRSELYLLNDDGENEDEEEIAYMKKVILNIYNVTN